MVESPSFDNDWEIPDTETERLDRALMIGGLPKHTICIDGGATSHMVPHDLQVSNNVLQEYRPFKKPRKVVVGSNHQLPWIHLHQ